MTARQKTKTKIKPKAAAAVTGRPYPRIITGRGIRSRGHRPGRSSGRGPCTPGIAPVRSVQGDTALRFPLGGRLLVATIGAGVHDMDG